MRASENMYKESIPEKVFEGSRKVAGLSGLFAGVSLAVTVAGGAVALAGAPEIGVQIAAYGGVGFLGGAATSVASSMIGLAMPMIFE